MNKQQPPKWIDRILDWYCKEEYSNEIRGDLMELYDRWLEKGKFIANIKYVLNAILFMRMYNSKINSGQNKTRINMFRNHFKIAWRTSMRNKTYLALNLLGLGTGIACFIVIMLYVQNEVTYDRMHTDSNRIYRVVKTRSAADISHSFVPSALMESMKQGIPEIEATVRLLQWNSGQLSYGKNTFNAKNFYVDNSFFELFTHAFVSGDDSLPLEDASSVVLTQSMAKKLFGDEDPLGKMVAFKNQNLTKNYEVSAVIDDVSSNSHIDFDYLLSIKGFPHFQRANSSWDNDELNAHTYIKLYPDVNPEYITEKIQQLVDSNNLGNKYDYSLQEMAGINGIHLTSHMAGELQANSDVFYIRVLVIMAAFIIFIAGVNYVNLTTARSSFRAKEVGVRKVVGARRKSLISQFLVESLFASMTAGLVAIVLAGLCMPFFNSLLQKDLSFFKTGNYLIWLATFAIILLVGLLAGLYPAVHLSRSNSTSLLKKITTTNFNGLNIRRVLVVTQFFMASLLIIGVLVLRNQLEFVSSKDLGINRENVVIISNGWQLPNRDKEFTFRQELTSIPGVVSVGAGEELGTAKPTEHFHQFYHKNSEDIIDVLNIEGDQNYLKTYGINLKEGSPLSPWYSVKDFNVVLNETAVRKLGLEEPVVGQKITFIRGNQNYDVPISGVVEDFHLNSLHSEVHPMYLTWNPDAMTIAIRIAGSNLKETLTKIENIWKKHTLRAPMEFHFLDNAIDQQYQNEKNFSKILFVITGLSVLIGCLGLFGLVAFVVQQRSKEVGIRKILGASIPDLLDLLVREYIYLIILANVISWPIAYYASSIWLENFAYRIEIGIWTFALTGASALVIAALTVSFQTIKASMVNPVNSLRSE